PCRAISRASGSGRRPTRSSGAGGSGSRSRSFGASAAETRSSSPTARWSTPTWSSLPPASRRRCRFLEDSVRREVEREDGFQLYRFILPPAVPRLGFIGYNSSTACQLTSEVAAHWLSDRFLGRLRLPDVDEMDREIARVRHWAADV